MMLHTSTGVYSWLSKDSTRLATWVEGVWQWHNLDGQDVDAILQQLEQLNVESEDDAMSETSQSGSDEADDALFHDAADDEHKDGSSFFQTNEGIYCSPHDADWILLDGVWYLFTSNGSLETPDSDGEFLSWMASVETEVLSSSQQ